MWFELWLKASVLAEKNRARGLDGPADLFDAIAAVLEPHRHA